MRYLSTGNIFYIKFLRRYFISLNIYFVQRYSDVKSGEAYHTYFTNHFVCDIVQSVRHKDMTRFFFFLFFLSCLLRLLILYFSNSLPKLVFPSILKTTCSSFSNWLYVSASLKSLILHLTVITTNFRPSRPKYFNTNKVTSNINICL